MYQKRWRYSSVTFASDLTDTLALVNENSPEIDIVAIHPIDAHHTTVVWREEIPEDQATHPQDIGG